MVRGLVPFGDDTPCDIGIFLDTFAYHEKGRLYRVFGEYIEYLFRIDRVGSVVERQRQFFSGAAVFAQYVAVLFEAFKH